jgi:rhodanese-related sulfurtransferase
MTSPLSKLIEPDALALVLDNDDLVIIDLCHPALYQQHHVPGAVHLAGQKNNVRADSSSGKMPSL